MKFSIITPVHLHNEERANLFARCIKSVNEQDYKGEFDHIIINDGSAYKFEIIENDHQKIYNQDHLERVNARRLGLEKAKGDIIVFLDSDDEFTPDALSRIEKMFEENPDYSMVNYGCTFIHKDGRTNNRGAFHPKEEAVGHEIFGPGNIVNGTFAFKREVYEDLGGFMPMHVENVDCTSLNYGGVRRLSASSPWDFSAFAQLEFPEIQQYFMVKHPDHPHNIVRELGDPFGDDFYLFYKYSRKYHSKPFDEYLLKVHPR